MKIVNIIGGLGNQMFQYALALALKEKFPDETVLFDTSHFESYRVHNGLELERVFGIDLPRAKFSELLKVTYPVKSYKLWRSIRKLLSKRRTECFENRDYTFNEHVFEVGNRYYEGYWQNYEYFKDILPVVLKSFAFRIEANAQTRSLLAFLDKEAATVSIHVRRGDYLKAPNYAGLCGVEYYRAALDYVLRTIPNPRFFIFSDDMDWCRANISPLLRGREHTFVDWNKGRDSALDMLLMSRCRHNVIANSSFSWWGACLNRNHEKVVCAPAKWTNTEVNCKFQMPDWVLF